MIFNQLLPPSEQALFEKAISDFSDRSIRLHANRIVGELPFAVSTVPWYRWGRFLDDSSVRPASFLNYAVADYYIQDAASMLPLALLEPQPSDVICDLCAAPGGKASAIAERLGPSGFLLANESIRSRVDVLKYALAKTGNPCFAVCSLDPDELASLTSSYFDAVLVDAPCSGQTLVARNKRDENAFAANQIEHCALRQQRILQSAIRMLRPGGRLIYSTCTFAVEENEAQMRWLQECQPGAWEPIELPQLEPWRSPIEPGCYRLWPHRDRCAGGFAAGLRLIRQIDFQSNTTALRTFKVRGGSRETSKQHNLANQRKILDKQKAAQALLSEIGQLHEVETDWQQGYLQCKTIGVAKSMLDQPELAMEPMAVLIEHGNHFVPTQGLALLDRNYFTPVKTIALDSDQAKQFASGSSIATEAGESLPRTSLASKTAGWSVATWNDRPLCWCKALSHRLNNHLPPWARLNVTQ